MKVSTLTAALAAAWLSGTIAVAYAKLPPPPPMSDAEKAAAAQKAAVAKAKTAEALQRAEDRAVANYRKNKGMAEPKEMPMAKKPGMKKSKK
jgi:hypothetical protein